MNAPEALQYLAQLSSDFARSLPPSAAMPLQAMAQEAVNVLGAAIAPPESKDAPPLRAVPPSPQ